MRTTRWPERPQPSAPHIATRPALTHDISLT